MEHKFSSIFLFISLIINTISYSQKDPFKFGKVSDEEMKMIYYDKDTVAEAVVLSDYGIAEIKIETGGTSFEIYFSRHTRIKILNKEGLSRATISIPLYKGEGGKYEDLKSLIAQTYNIENGKMVETKLSKKDIMTVEESENWIIKKFAFPNVKVGSVIEYEYSISSPYLYNFQNWLFQYDIPVVWSEYLTMIPEYFKYNIETIGYLNTFIKEEDYKVVNATIVEHLMAQQGVRDSRETVSSNISYRCKINRWVYKDVPAFRTEKYITTPRDYMARIEFELATVEMPNSDLQTYSSSWEKIANDLMINDNFGAALNRHSMVKELTDRINTNDSIEKKIETAYNLIRQNLKWDESYAIFINKTLKSVSNTKQGNMAEVNLLLINLLRSIGVEAYPVLISTRSNGKINRFYPRLSSFNTVIALARVKGKNILMDATISYLRPGQLTYNCINGEGLMVSKEGIAWVPLLSTEQYFSSTVGTIEFKNGKASASLIRASKSLKALRLRQNIAIEGKENYIANVKNKNSGWDISEYTFENENNSNEIVKEKIVIDHLNTIDVNGRSIYLPSILVDKVEENPFSSETREYPVDFAVPINEKYIMSISIPDDYVVDELPPVASFSMPEKAASFSYQVQQSGKILQIISQLRITKTLYPPTEYLLLKEFYKNIISKYGEQIVLKKKV